jgi:hypothetical protein
MGCPAAGHGACGASGRHPIPQKERTVENPSGSGPPPMRNEMTKIRQALGRWLSLPALRCIQDGCWHNLASRTFQEAHLPRLRMRGLLVSFGVASAMRLVALDGPWARLTPAGRKLLSSGGKPPGLPKGGSARHNGRPGTFP